MSSIVTLLSALPFLCAKKETFADGGAVAAPSNAMVAVSVIANIVNTVLFCIAIYLSLKRNGGFNFGSFLAACCCSLCYIVYALAVPASPPAPAALPPAPQ